MRRGVCVVCGGDMQVVAHGLDPTVLASGGEDGLVCLYNTGKARGGGVAWIPSEREAGLGVYEGFRTEGFGFHLNLATPGVAMSGLGA
jgi:hypothetical protein